MKHILLAGIPGTGKTTMGNYLKNNYGFAHYDFEDLETLRLYTQDKAGFVTNSLAQDKVVISWGFMPYGHTEHVLEIKRRGFEIIWLDGNREVAFREFMKRGTVSEKAYRNQMENIETSGVVEKIQPRIINTFDDDGQFRKPIDIARDILEIN